MEMPIEVVSALWGGEQGEWKKSFFSSFNIFLY